jgi:hypothetical protein
MPAGKLRFVLRLTGVTVFIHETLTHLGQQLSRLTRHLLLRTAMPHNGKKKKVHRFLALLDSDRLAGRVRDGVYLLAWFATTDAGGHWGICPHSHQGKFRWGLREPQASKKTSYMFGRQP